MIISLSLPFSSVSSSLTTIEFSLLPNEISKTKIKIHRERNSFCRHRYIDIGVNVSLGGTTIVE